MIPVGAFSVWLCLKTAPFASDSANLTLAGVMIVIHALCCQSNGFNFFEGGCAMAIVLVLAILLFPTLHKAHPTRETTTKTRRLDDPSLGFSRFESYA
jgi:hypothetical protein